MPSTKRTSPAEQKLQAVEPPKERGAIPAAFYEPPAISPTHELIIDAVAEILSHGGNPDDVDALLRATMRHTRRRSFPREAPQSQIVSAFVRDKMDQWKADLVVQWRLNEHSTEAERRRTEPPKVFDGETMSDLIRFNLREWVWASFAEFMDDASAEEQALMVNVLQHQVNRHHLPEARNDEIYLATAFESELGRNGAYVKVPEHMVPAVEKYIDALRAIEDRAAA